MPAQPNQSLIDGLLVLQTLVSHEGALGSREMASLLGLEHTRVNRLLGTLAMIGLAQKTPDRRYCPGPAVHVLAAQSLHGSHLLSAALPQLEILRAGGLNVTLGVLWGRQLSFLFRARPGMTTSECIGNWPSEPAGHSSAGVSLLAQSALDETEISLLQAELQNVQHEGAHSLAQTLEWARQNGYARIVFPENEVSLGIVIGQPPLAGLAVSGRFGDGQEREIVALLRESAAHITQELGRLSRR